MVTKGIVLFMLVILFASTDAATCGYDDAKLNRPTIGCILSCKVQVTFFEEKSKNSWEFFFFWLQFFNLNQININSANRVFLFS